MADENSDEPREAPGGLAFDIRLKDAEAEPPFSRRHEEQEAEHQAGERSGPGLKLSQEEITRDLEEKERKRIEHLHSIQEELKKHDEHVLEVLQRAEQLYSSHDNNGEQTDPAMRARAEHLHSVQIKLMGHEHRDQGSCNPPENISS